MPKLCKDTCKEEKIKGKERKRNLQRINNEKCERLETQRKRIKTKRFSRMLLWTHKYNNNNKCVSQRGSTHDRKINRVFTFATLADFLSGYCCQELHVSAVSFLFSFFFFFFSPLFSFSSFFFFFSLPVDSSPGCLGKPQRIHHSTRKKTEEHTANIADAASRAATSMPNPNCWSALRPCVVQTPRLVQNANPRCKRASKLDTVRLQSSWALQAL